MYRLEFTIMELPKIISNGSQSNWRVIAGMRKAWKEKTLKAINFRLPPKPLAVADCTFVRASSMEPDDDNLRASFKSIRDALVVAGVLENDKPSNMPNPKYLWRKERPGRGWVGVVVQEIST